MTKRKKPSEKIRSQKRAADEAFSKYIRLKEADENGYVKCVTCGKVDHWKNMDAGHYITRAYTSTRFEENNVWPQCRKDNRFLNGRADDMERHIKEVCGEEEVERLRWLKHQPCKQTAQQYGALAKYYREKVKNLGG